ncbi:sensor histidine kinase [Microbacterium sp. RD1]|uniref:sensor histidine kinase n=1 Tax=Microbacterium sp. RD1 TaxID=3457313 RepID=UPI003FA52CBB
MHSPHPPRPARRDGGDRQPPPLYASIRPGVVFVAIVFVTTLAQVLVDPIAAALLGAQEWPLPIPVGATLALLITGCALQSSSLLLSRVSPGAATTLAVLVYLALLFVLGAPFWLFSMQLVIALSLFLLAARTSGPSALTGCALVIVTGAGAPYAWSSSVGADGAVLAGFLLSHGLGLAASATGGTALGVWWGAQTRRVEQARDEADRARVEHEARIARARAVERARIGQELHDVAGQHLAGLVTLADAAVALAADRPSDALDLVREVREEGRFAAASLGGALADLRAADADPLEETRDLRHAPELVLFWRRRGMDVSLRTDGEITDLPVVVSTTAYRAVQEAITNAAKYAPGASVAVAIARERKLLQVVVENGPRRADAEDVPGLGLGWGIDGIRERIELLRGEVWVGATGTGGWLVRVRVPIAPSAGSTR